VSNHHLLDGETDQTGNLPAHLRKIKVKKEKSKNLPEKKGKGGPTIVMRAPCGEKKIGTKLKKTRGKVPLRRPMQSGDHGTKCLTGAERLLVESGREESDGEKASRNRSTDAVIKASDEDGRSRWGARRRRGGMKVL